MFFTYYSKSTLSKSVLLFLALSFISLQDTIAQTGGNSTKSALSDPTVFMLVIIMLILLLVIGLLAYVVVGAASYYRVIQKKEEEKEAAAKPLTPIVSALVLLFVSVPVFAQDAAAVKVTNHFGSLSTTAFYCLVAVLAVELIVIFVLLAQLRTFIARKQAAALAGNIAAKRPLRISSAWNRLNKLRPIEQEADIVMDHEYDGIRELDNRLPPWWLYGFYISIVVGGIYLWRYHVSHSAPSSEQEFQIAMQAAEKQKEEYLKTAANNIDENTVKLIEEPAALASGKALFIQNCAACHGKDGEGTVGPNLTDNYWLHGGSVKDVFKTIKYGYPEKGMRSWKDDFSPSQISQITSFIKSLKGTNPANAKEKQGDLFEEAGVAVNDSSVVKK